MYWKRGVLKLLFKKKYQNFFMLAEVRSITDWLFFWLAFTFFQRKGYIFGLMVGMGKKLELMPK